MDSVQRYAMGATCQEGARKMTTYRIGKLIYCSTKIRHDLVIYDEPARHIVWRFWWSY